MASHCLEMISQQLENHWGMEREQGSADNLSFLILSKKSDKQKFRRLVDIG